MVTFIQTVYDGDKKIVSKIAKTSYDRAREIALSRFNLDNDVAKFEETKYQNGARSLALKNKENKIVLLLKTTD